jgi:hypothetical protein
MPEKKKILLKMKGKKKKKIIKTLNKKTNKPNLGKILKKAVTAKGTPS